MSRWLVAGLCALSLAATFAVPASAADSLLNNEIVQVTDPGLGMLQTSGTANCNPSGSSTVSFTVSGDATGPYPGAFHASGSYTLGPQTQTGSQNSFFLNIGPVLTLNESFTITSVETTITGTKHLTAPAPDFGSSGGPLNTGTCGGFSGADLGFGGLVDATGTAVEAVAYLSYEATIQSPTDTFHDSGDSFVSLDELNVRSSAVGSRTGGDFFEWFFTSRAPAPPTNVDQCKDGGWRNYGTVFKNQGDCVSFVSTGGKNSPSGG
jgi:hypothetical protein